MNCVGKSIIAAAALSAVTAGCATYDYGYSQPYAYGYSSGPYYEPYYYSGPYYSYGPAYYVGPPAVGFYYYDSGGHRHWSNSSDHRHWSGGNSRNTARNEARWNGNRGQSQRAARGAPSRQAAPAFAQGRDRSITPEAAARAEQHG